MRAARPDRRPVRRGEKGQAAIIVAVAGIAMLAMAGLALDGGLAASRYRQTRNASDAGALAGARAVYLNAVNSAGLAADTIAQREVSHNLSSCVLPTSSNCHQVSITLLVPSATGGDTSDGAVATVNSGVSTDVLGLGDLNITGGLEFGGTHGTTQTKTPSSVASGSIDMVNANTGVTVVSSLLNGSASGAVYSCSSQSSSKGTVDSVSACPSGSLSALSSVNVGGVATVDTASALGIDVTTPPSVVKQSTSSSVNSQNDPSVSNVNAVGTVGSPRRLGGGVTASGTGLITATHLGAASGAVNEAKTVLSVTNLTITIPGNHTGAGLTITISALTMRAQVLADPVNGLSGALTCTGPGGTGNATITFSGPEVTGGSSFTTSVGSSCATGNLGPFADNITVTGAQPPTLNCQTGTNPIGSVCSLQSCLLHITVPANVVATDLTGANVATTVCVGEANASVNVTPQTAPAGYLVTSHIPLNTTFMRVVGTLGVDPSATATAKPEQVSDAVQPDGSVWGVAEDMTSTTDNGCSSAYGPPQVGCDYIVWGSGMDPNLYFSSTCGNWQGRLDPASAHAQGKVATCRNETASLTSGPPVYTPNGTFYLLPVISNSDGTVLYWAAFQPVSAGAAKATMVAKIVQGTTTTSWSTADPGAVSLKLTN